MGLKEAKWYFTYHKLIICGTGLPFWWHRWRGWSLWWELVCVIYSDRCLKVVVIQGIWILIQRLTYPIISRKWLTPAWNSAWGLPNCGRGSFTRGCWEWPIVREWWLQKRQVLVEIWRRQYMWPGRGFCTLAIYHRQDLFTIRIPHFHIDHKAPYSPPKILHNHSLWMLLGQL